MSQLFTVLTFIGYIIMFVGAIWILIKAFQESILWGLGSLFIPFVILIFAFMHWKACKKPFLIWLLGLVIAIVFMVIAVVAA